MKPIIYRDNCLIFEDFLINIYILTENLKWKFHYIKLYTNNNALIFDLKINTLQYFDKQYFDFVLWRENEISYNNERIIKFVISGKNKLNSDLTIEYAVAGKEATYIANSKVKDYIETEKYSDNLAKKIFKIDYCNHEYIQLFTGVCCKHCGEYK